MRQSTVCVVCHAHFVARRATQVTCSNRCYMRNQRHPGKPDEPRACENCAEQFPPGAHRAKKYCTSRCASAAIKRRNRPIRAKYVRHTTCGHCGGELGDRAGRRFCSDRCCSRESRWPGSYPYFVNRKCERCGEPVPIKAKREARFCTARCQNLANQVRRRARHQGLAVESFSRMDVFERDGWICHICREPVDRVLEWPHPRAASLDHVIPLNEADSPGHVFANAACSHLFCNHSKHDRTRYEDRALYVALAATGKPPLAGALF